MSDSTLTGQAAEIRDEFLDLDLSSRLELLLEFSNELPALPARFADHPELLERVAECQAPVFIVVEVDDGVVTMFAQAPPEAPTTRGFASILAQTLNGLTVDEALALPDDYPQMLGLSKAVSPLRLNGMSGMLQRAKRQLRARVGR